MTASELVESAHAAPCATSTNQIRVGRPRREVISPRLRKLLLVVFALLAVLGANSVYLLSIRLLGWVTNRAYQDQFFLWMILAHLVLGLLLLGPLVVFGVCHWRTAHQQPNRRAVRMGQALFCTSLVVMASGLVLMLMVFRTTSLTRQVVFWLHVLSPLVAVWLYVLHRLAGPPIRWQQGVKWSAAVAGVVLMMVVLHLQDPRHWGREGPAEGEKYFAPALTRTANGNFIPARALMNDQYCLECHSDIHARWKYSAHRFSSFNNPAYLFSVKQTRDHAMQHDGHVKSSRFCAGCHDPVPFLSGAFDDPQYDIVNDPTAHAGITCTVCHAITHVNSTQGNGAYTIEEPLHYPFAYSSNGLLKFINRRLILAKPEFHKRTFLKPLHKTAEFCSTCHKVSLPGELTKYKEFLRGQNHYDSFLLSGVSGVGAMSFYYPPTAHENCNGCHMPLRESGDFAARRFDARQPQSVHDHLFPGANTGIAHLLGMPQLVIEAHQNLLKDCLRVDIFGIRAGTNVTAPLVAPLRPRLPELKPGHAYVIEVVIRTLTVGHDFTQGTADSNEVWLEMTATSDGRVIGHSGGLDENGGVDPWSYFLNVYMLDQKGNRIDRRNAQDIFVPLYNHQIKPGGARVARFGLRVPADVKGPLTLEIKVRYRKFDLTYLRYVKGKHYRNDLPITDLAQDRLTLPIAGAGEPPAAQASPIPPWQRWNDHGIGLLQAAESDEGATDLRQAIESFQQVEQLKRPDGPLNLVRTYLKIGQVPRAAAALRRARDFDPPPPRWTVAWLSGRVSKQYGDFDAAITQLRGVLEDRYEELRRRKFDFSRDYRIINQLGLVLFEKAKLETGNTRNVLLRDAAAQFHKTLSIDSENVAAHHNLALVYEAAEDTKAAAKHRSLHQKYKIDEVARDEAHRIHRGTNPAANHAANSGAIYSLHRDATGTPVDLQEPAKP